MSSIASVGGSGSGIAQMLQRLAQQRGGATGASPFGGSPPNDSQRAEMESKFKDAALAAGLDPKAADGLQDEIKSSISDALKNTDGTNDPRQAVQDAIDSTLKKNGVDLEKFKSQMQSSMGGMSGMGPPGGMPPMGGMNGQSNVNSLLSNLKSAYAGNTSNTSSQLLTSLFSLVDETA